MLRRYLQTGNHHFVSHTFQFIIHRSSRLSISEFSSFLVLAEVSVEYFRGLPQVTVPLPSRRERCRFTLRPVSNTVGDFLAMLCHEDHGIDRVAVSSVGKSRRYHCKGSHYCAQQLRTLCMCRCSLKCKNFLSEIYFYFLRLAGFVVGCKLSHSFET
jgi:hypothetical protein